MNATTLQDLLIALLQSLADAEDATICDVAEAAGVLPEDLRHVQSFAAGCYLTRDAGLVAQLPDGSELQITIVAR